MLMEYQNRRGGRVALKNILMPEMEFNNAEKGEALYAMELALSLEKLNFSKLRELHAVGSKHEDANCFRQACVGVRVPAAPRRQGPGCVPLRQEPGLILQLLRIRAMPEALPLLPPLSRHPGGNRVT
eukprot:363662-Chlamydomonas_euryale.AAC.23